LFLTQACLTLQRKYQVPLTFRQLMEDLSSPTRLAEYLDQHLPAEAQPAAAPPAPAPAPLAPLPSTPLRTGDVVAEATQQLIAQQLQIMARQLELLGAAPPATSVSAPVIERNGVVPTPATPPASPATPPTDTARPFGAAARITLKHAGLTPRQQEALTDITRRYNDKTRHSKQHP